MGMNKIKSPVSIRKFNVGSITELELDGSQDFLGEILEELNENVPSEERGDEAYIKFEGELEKISGKYEEFMHFVGTINTTFYCHDVITNEVMSDSLEQEVRCLVLSKEVGQKLQLEDEIDIEHNGEEYDLYFTDDEDFLDIKGIIHEYIFLNKNPYPKKTTDSPEED